jgi:hypothetical protein
LLVGKPVGSDGVETQPSTVAALMAIWHRQQNFTAWHIELSKREVERFCVKNRSTNLVLE